MHLPRSCLYLLRTEIAHATSSVARRHARQEEGRGGTGPHVPDMTSARRLTVDLYLLVGGGGGDGGGGALVLQYVITVSFAAFAEGEINIVSDVQRHFFCDGLGDLDRADAMTAAELARRPMTWKRRARGMKRRAGGRRRWAQAKIPVSVRRPESADGTHPSLAQPSERHAGTAPLARR